MKRKIGLALAVILVGVLVVIYTQTKGEKVEPTSTPISSSISASSAPVATEEPAETPEPSPSSQPVNQEVEEGYSSDDAEPVEEDYDAAMEAYWQECAQKYIDKYGMSEEEAWEWVEKSKQMAAEDQAEMEKNRQEASEKFWEEHNKTVEEATAKEEAYLQERYGLSYEEWCALSSKEQMEYSLTHPWNE